MYITKHTNVTDRTLLDSLWELYTRAYVKIAEEDVSRETLYRSEFDDVMADPTYRTTVVRDDDNQPIAMAVVATDISVTRYRSVPYFRRHYPDRMAEGRVHYIMWVVVHPDHQAGSASWELARAGFSSEVDEGALLVFDLPESNQGSDEGGVVELFRRVASSIAEVELESFGRSRYYALDFAPDRAAVAPTSTH